LPPASAWVGIGSARVGFGSSATTEVNAEGIQIRSFKIYEQSVQRR
jgi:hypothetical protein